MNWVRRNPRPTPTASELDAPFLKALSQLQGPRSEIARIARTDPGIPLVELRDRVGLGWGSLYHHIGKLSDAGLVRLEVAGRRRLLYPGQWSQPRVEGADDLRTRALQDSLLRGASCREIAEALCGGPFATIGDLCAATGLSSRLTYYHLRQLSKAGLSTSSSETRYIDIDASDRLRIMLGKTPKVAPEPAPER